MRAVATRCPNARRRKRGRDALVGGTLLAAVVVGLAVAVAATQGLVALLELSAVIALAGAMVLAANAGTARHLRAQRAVSSTSRFSTASSPPAA